MLGRFCRFEGGGEHRGFGRAWRSCWGEARSGRASEPAVMQEAGVGDAGRPFPDFGPVAEVAFLAADGGGHGRIGEAEVPLTSMPVKMWWSRALVAWRILVTSTGCRRAWVVSRPGRWKTARPAGWRAPRPRGARPARARFHPLAHVDRAGQHHRVELFHRTHLLRRNHRDIEALGGQHVGDIPRRPGDPRPDGSAPCGRAGASASRSPCAARGSRAPAWESTVARRRR